MVSLPQRAGSEAATSRQRAGTDLTEVPLPEGHTIHRLAHDLADLFEGSPVRVSALQDRFAAGISTLDGGTVLGTDAWGKHLFVCVAPAAPGREPVWLHVHLGLIGKFAHGPGPAPAPAGALRLRLESERGWADLRGATICELLDAGQRQLLINRLGEDPLRKKADPLRPWKRISRSRVDLGALLMQQEVLAGVGNVYRAEILFRHRLSPHRPGRELELEQWLALWTDLRVLMRAGVRTGKIVTTLPADRPRGARGPAASVPREAAHYVYRRAGLPCRVCDQPVAAELFVGRNLYWCPVDQLG